MVMCRVLQVSCSGYYDWVGRPLLDRARDNERLLVLIRASHIASGGIYGALRVTDITYIRTWQGWFCLAVAIDLFARKVVGWSMKPTLAKELVLDALPMSVWRRRPTETVIVHSDQGAQYGSDAWYRFCVSHHLKPGMSRRGNCWDNAVAESFFSSLKKERIKKQIYRARDQARADIFDYIEMFYNRRRRHGHLGDVSPEAFEQASKCSGAVSV